MLTRGQYTRILERLLFSQEADFSAELAQELRGALEKLEQQMGDTPSDQIPWAVHVFIETIKEVKERHENIQDSERITLETVVNTLINPIRPSTRDIVLAYILSYPDKNHEVLATYYGEGRIDSLKAMIRTLKRRRFVEKGGGKSYKLTPEGQSRAKELLARLQVPLETLPPPKYKGEGAIGAVISYLRQHSGMRFAYRVLSEELNLPLSQVSKAVAKIKSETPKEGRFEVGERQIMYTADNNHYLEPNQEISTYTGPIEKGHKVKVTADGRERTVIVGNDANIETGMISVMSPLGRALIGKYVKEEILVRTPNGSLSYRIISIEPS